MLNILINPARQLRKKSKDIELKNIGTKEITKLCSAMAKSMLKNDGVGLSAPQVGKNIKLIVINMKDGPLCLINPRIVKKSWAKELGVEGCLSVPGIYGKVNRHKKITCIYFSETGKKVKFNAQGLMARVIQHETDHLNGILFIDKAKDIEKITNE